MFVSVLMMVASLAVAGDLAVPSTSRGAQQEGVAEVDPVTVEGRRLGAQVQSFIEEVAAPPPGRRLARWSGEICVGVSNMDARYAQVMIDRVASTAIDLGLDMAGPGCKPHVMIVAAADADNLAQAMVADDGHGFRPGRSATDAGENALRHFQTTDAPVRWWHVSLPVLVDTGEVAMALDGEIQVGRVQGVEGGLLPFFVKVRDASRARSNTREDLARVVIIIDTTRVGGISFSALSDYVAMVALAQVKLDADVSAHDTVLNLFAQGADRPGGMTQWDRDYLKSLYTARGDRRRSTQQRTDILRGMTGERDMRIWAEDDDR